jgi:hypothetical protein
MLINIEVGQVWSSREFAKGDDGKPDPIRRLRVARIGTVLATGNGTGQPLFGIQIDGKGPELARSFDDLFREFEPPAAFWGE